MVLNRIIFLKFFCKDSGSFNVPRHSPWSQFLCYNLVFYEDDGSNESFDVPKILQTLDFYPYFFVYRERIRSCYSSELKT